MDNLPEEKNVEPCSLLSDEGAELLDSAFDIVCHVLRVRRCSLMLLDSDRQRLDVVKVFGTNGVTPGIGGRRIGEGIAGRVAATEQPMLVTDVTEVDLPTSGSTYLTRSFISVPVTVQGRLYGVVNVSDRLDGRPLNTDDLGTLELLAQHISQCIQNSMLREEIRKLATTDGLTDLCNRRHFQQVLSREIERARLTDSSLCLLMMDLHKFKDLNDRYGHLAGDAALQQAACLLRANTRRTDIAFRYGGDEFCVIMPDTALPDALATGERVMRALRAHHPEYNGLRLSITLDGHGGVSSYPSLANSYEELIAQADRAMYAAKRKRASVRAWNVGTVMEFPSRRRDDEDLEDGYDGPHPVRRI